MMKKIQYTDGTFILKEEIYTPESIIPEFNHFVVIAKQKYTVEMFVHNHDFETLMIVLSTVKK